MSRKRMSIILVLVLLGIAIAQAPPANAVSISGLDIIFERDGIWVDNPYSVLYDRDNTGTGEEAIHIAITDGSGKLLYWEEDTLEVGYGFTDGGDFFVPYLVTPDYNPITLTWYSSAGNGLPEEIALAVSGSCDGLPLWADTGNCDTKHIPWQAVNGRFLDNAVVFSEPGVMTSPPVVIETGKTYLVVGLDASGQYYKILLSCQWVWVEADKVGLDFNPPWNGAALPTIIVD